MLKPILSCIFLLFILVGCANEFDQLEADYYTGRYLHAGQLAVEGYTKSNLKPKISEFFKKQGNKFLEKIKNSTDQALLGTQTDAGIRYAQDVITLYESLLTTELPLSHVILKEHLTFIRQKLKTVIEQYVSQEKNLAKQNFENQQYRESVRHAQHVLKYSIQDNEIQKIKEDAEKKAQRSIYIQPTHHAITKSAFVIQGMNASDQIGVRLIKTFQEKKSTYLNVASDKKNAAYILETEFLIKELDSQLYPKKEFKQDTLRYLVKEAGVDQWITTIGTYEILSGGYECTLQLSATIFIQDQNKPLKRFSVQKTIKRENLFKGAAMNIPSQALQVQYPSGYTQLRDNPMPIDKTQVVQETIQFACVELVHDILSTIDQDVDPYGR